MPRNQEQPCVMVPLPAFRHEVRSMTSRMSIPPTTTTTTASPTKAKVPAVTIEEEGGNRGVDEQEGEPTNPRATLLWKNKRKKKRPCKSPPSASSRPTKRKYTSTVATAAPRDSNSNVVPVPVEPEEPPSRFTRRTRRSGGSGSAGGGGGEDATYMSLQIRYRGGNDWDPLNACWVPKQPKTKKPKTTHEPQPQVQQQQEQQVQQQQEQHVEKDCHHRDNHDDDDGTAITESSSATEQDSITLSIQCGSAPTSSAEPRVPRDVQQMENWFEKAVWVEQIDETTTAAMTVVVEGDEMESEDNDKNRKVDPGTAATEKRNENGTELSLNTKQPIGNEEDVDEDEDDDEEFTTSKRSLLQEEPVPPCLNRPVECHPSVDKKSASSHSECNSESSSDTFLPEEPTSDLQVEQPQQENPLLDALFQAVEMAQEMPVDNTEDDTNTSSHVIACDCACAPSVSFSAIDEDIFADAPYDDSINIPVPWCGEDAASKLPRSLLNIYVYGPTPAHMAEIWHKMYGVQC